MPRLLVLTLCAIVPLGGCHAWDQRSHDSQDSTTPVEVVLASEANWGDIENESASDMAIPKFDISSAPLGSS